jgi:Holliday junction resolvase
MTKSEKSIETKIRKSLEEINAYQLKQFGSAFTGKGAPDIVASILGNFFAIEVKNELGTVTGVQMKHLVSVANSKGAAFITRDPDFVENTLSVSEVKIELLDRKEFRVSQKHIKQLIEGVNEQAILKSMAKSANELLKENPTLIITVEPTPS